MGILDNILNSLGFEAEGGSENAAPKQPRAKTERGERKPRLGKSSSTPNRSKYDLINDILPTYEGQASGGGVLSGSYNVEGTENGININKNVIVYSPKNQNDIKNLIDFLRRKEPIIVNFERLDDNIAPAMVSFISGALYALKGSIHPISEGLYLLTPEGVNILIPKERKREE